MTARFKLICALVLLAAGLAGLLYFKPGKEAVPEYAISDLTADAAKSVRIERSGKEHVALELRDGKWRITVPFAARADLAQVENLLSLVTAKSTVRYPQAELARFDLEQPLLKVNINDQEVLFGGINPVSGEQYVGTRGYVYLISPRHGSAAQAESWASRKLLAEDEEPARFEFPSFAVVKSEDRWSLSPQSGEPAQEDFNIWLNRWRLATSLATLQATSMQATQFKITLTDGKQIPMAYGEKDSEFFLVRQDEQLQYQFAPAIGKPLVEPPAAVVPRE